MSIPIYHYTNGAGVTISVSRTVGCISSLGWFCAPRSEGKLVRVENWCSSECILWEVKSNCISWIERVVGVRQYHTFFFFWVKKEISLLSKPPNNTAFTGTRLIQDLASEWAVLFRDLGIWYRWLEGIKFFELWYTKCQCRRNQGHILRESFRIDTAFKRMINSWTSNNLRELPTGLL